VQVLGKESFFLKKSLKRIVSIYVIDTKIKAFKKFIKSGHENIATDFNFSHFADYSEVDRKDIDYQDMEVDATVSLVNRQISFDYEIENGASMLYVPIEVELSITWRGYKGINSETWMAGDISMFAVLVWNSIEAEWVVSTVEENLDDVA